MILFFIWKHSWQQNSLPEEAGLEAGSGEEFNGRWAQQTNAETSSHREFMHKELAVNGAQKNAPNSRQLKTQLEISQEGSRCSFKFQLI
jgi:hypothetical protein